MSNLAFNADYLQRLAVRDPEVLEHFFGTFDDRLRFKINSKVRNRQIVADLRQETYLRVFAALKQDRLDSPDRLAPFVHSVCNNVLQEYYRSRKKHQPAPDDAPELMDANADSAAVLMKEETDRIVRDVLQELPEKDRQILRMKFLEELSNDEVCEKMGINRDYLRVLFFRARKRFKEIWDEKYGDSGRERGHV